MHYETWMQSYLRKKRDELKRDGYSKEDISWAIATLWTNLEQPQIVSVDQYKTAVRVHSDILRDNPQDDSRSQATIRLDALRRAMIEFEESYDRRHGRLPPIN